MMTQIAEQTHEEKVKMYMALPKKQIIEMLIECNRILDFRNEQKQSASNETITLQSKNTSYFSDAP